MRSRNFRTSFKSLMTSGTETIWVKKKVNGAGTSSHVPTPVVFVTGLDPSNVVDFLVKPAADPFSHGDKFGRLSLLFARSTCSMSERIAERGPSKYRSTAWRPDN